MGGSSTPSISSPVLDREQLIAASQHGSPLPQSPSITTYLALGTPFQGQGPRLPRQSLVSLPGLASHSGGQHFLPSPQRNPSPALSTITTYLAPVTPFQGQSPRPSHATPVVPLEESKEVQLLHRLISLESMNGVGSEPTLDPLEDLFILAITQVRYRSAETYARRYLSASRTLYGDHDQRTGRGLAILGGSLSHQGHYLQALKVLQKASDVLRRILPPEHTYALDNEFDIGYTHLRLGDSDEALKIFRRTEETALGVLGPVHEITLTAQVYLNEALLLLQQSPEAEQRLNVLMTKLEDHSSTLHSSFLTRCRISHALLLRKTSRLQEAADVLETLLQERMETYGPEHPMTLMIMYSLAQAYMDLGRIPEALDKINLCISGRERVVGPDHPESKSAREVRDEILKQMGHHNQ
jgi:tetratricopeptide (TPR) repeat protein